MKDVIRSITPVALMFAFIFGAGFLSVFLIVLVVQDITNVPARVALAVLIPTLIIGVPAILTSFIKSKLA